MHKFLSLAVLFTLAGCGTDPVAACQSYFDAYETCINEAYGDDAGSYALDPAYCDVYDGTTGAAAQTAADLMNCYADAYAGADCSTTEGVTAASEGVTACATAG